MAPLSLAPTSPPHPGGLSSFLAQLLTRPALWLMVIKQ